MLETYEALETLRSAKVSPTLKKIEISRIQGSNSMYINLAKWFHSRIKSPAYTSVFAQRRTKEEEPERVVEAGKQYFPEEWSKDKFDEFLMLCSTKDQFEAGSQVFFCYGRLSNRLLLMRYGIAVEHNKYNHLFLRLDMAKYSKDY
ncbi:MAG: hypothetical protein JST59_01650 [Actinobacteria bacterium]|nr:hypothetical protein [Actinomycetota bacterium]